MINSITVKNFKSLKNISVNLSNLNLFTGINGVGKSTLIQILLLLKQSNEEKISLNGDFINIGSVSDALCESRNNDNIEFIIENINGGIKENIKIKLNYSNKYDDYFKSQVVINNSNSKSKYSYIKNLINDIQYLSAERIGPKHFYKTNYSNIQNNFIGIHGEYSLHYLLENQNNDIPLKKIAKHIVTKKINNEQDKIEEIIDYSLKTQLEAWMGEISPNIISKAELYKEINLIGSFFSYKQKNKPDTSAFKAPNIGFGISYVLPVILSILMSKKDDIVIIENPEAHLHPKGQVVLAELMALAAQNGVQLIIETHSDHIFDGIRIATKENKISNKKLSVIFFDRKQDEHITEITNIIIDSNGRIDKMPKNFFDQFDINLSKLL